MANERILFVVSVVVSPKVSLGTLKLSVTVFNLYVHACCCFVHCLPHCLLGWIAVWHDRETENEYNGLTMAGNNKNESMDLDGEREDEDAFQ